MDNTAPSMANLNSTLKKSTFQAMRRRNGHGDLEKSLRSTKKAIPYDELKAQLK